MSENNNNINNDEVKETAPENKSFLTKALDSVKALGKTLWRWTKRMFLGASKELSEMDVMAVENLESPSKMAVKTFFRRKLAVAALVVLVSLFLFVFLAPIFIPINLNYTDSLQANIAPNYSMLSVPKGLRNNVKTISGFANFTVGVSNDNTLYMWGYTEDALKNTDLSEFPEEIEEGKVYTAAAGSDHVVAITIVDENKGKLVAWGDKTRAQYGYSATGDGLVYMPEWLANETIDLDKIEQLVCGYQVTALVYDGHLYMWGNKNALINLPEMVSAAANKPVKEVALGNYYGLILYKDGTVESPANLNSKTTVISNLNGKVKFSSIGSKATNIAATNNCFLILSGSGELFVQGSGEYGENEFVEIPAGEKVIDITSGTRHFVALTDNGHAYAWGHNDYGQTEINGESAATIYAGAKQTYLVDENDEITEKVGLKGYLFGTDKLGRDTFARIIHGGKMTMTVGAVAVVVSTIIAIIVGCLSGYFGGWVDMLLMRVTEIFSAIPFLPFAMMLSYVIQKNPIDETTRIIIIMIMLGLLSWTGLARMIRGQVLAEREKEFVIAAKAMGIKEKRIAFKHILPNVISVILVSVTLDFAGCLLTESSLSYLGFGVQQPRPTWGNMLNGSNNSIVIQNYWWQWVFPAIFLSIATISINIIGDTLRDVLDPKSSREK